jgi:hypothetical protein
MSTPRRPIPQGWLTSSETRPDPVRPRVGGLDLGGVLASADADLRGGAPPDGRPAPPPRPLLTTDEAAALCRVCPRTIRNWRAQGLLSPVRVTRRTVFYRLQDVHQLLGISDD